MMWRKKVLLILILLILAIIWIILLILLYLFIFKIIFNNLKKNFHQSAPAFYLHPYQESVLLCPDCTSRHYDTWSYLIFHILCYLIYHAGTANVLSPEFPVAGTDFATLCLWESLVRSITLLRELWNSKEAVDLASSLVVHILFDIAIINFDQNNSKYVYHIFTQYSECLSCIYCSVSFFIVFIALWSEYFYFSCLKNPCS